MACGSHGISSQARGPASVTHYVSDARYPCEFDHASVLLGLPACPRRPGRVIGRARKISGTACCRARSHSPSGRRSRPRAGSRTLGHRRTGSGRPKRRRIHRRRRHPAERRPGAGSHQGGEDLGVDNRSAAPDTTDRIQDLDQVADRFQGPGANGGANVEAAREIRLQLATSSRRSGVALDGNSGSHRVQPRRERGRAATYAGTADRTSGSTRTPPCTTTRTCSRAHGSTSGSPATEIRSAT